MKGAEDMDDILILLERWQTDVAAMLMLVLSSGYLISDLRKKGIWRILLNLAPAAFVLMWAIAVPGNNETTWISGKAIAFGFFFMV
ncbi:MAG: hypothetical protein PHG20_12625 [Geobacteraceae bacterium]|nr:hypothetical protein [Geobacteraceae bacterium]